MKNKVAIFGIIVQLAGLIYGIVNKAEDIIAFGPDTLIKEIAPTPGGDEMATISSLNSITYKLLVKVALLLCSVLS